MKDFLMRLNPNTNRDDGGAVSTEAYVSICDGLHYIANKDKIRVW